MDEKELSKLINGIAEKNSEAISTSVKKEINEASKGFLTVDQLASKLEEKGIDAKAINELTKAVEKQGLEITRMIEGNGKREKGVEELLHDNIDKLKRIAKGEKISFEIELPKANKAVVQTTAYANNTLGLRIPGVGEIPYRAGLMSSLFRQGADGNGMGGVVRYTDQVSITRAAAEVVESNGGVGSGVYPESAITWGEFVMPLRKIGDQIPVTMEAMDDIDYMASEIDRLLNVNVALREDQQLWNGNGSAPNINGIYTQAATYTAPDLALTQVDLFGLIVKVAEVINAGNESRFRANTAIVSYAEFNAMLLSKSSSDGHYLQPNFVSFANGEANVNGIRVIPSALVTTNTMLVGDFNQGTQYNQGGIIIEMGVINDQFIKDITTLKARKRTNLLVRTVDVNAFRKVTNISAAITTLNNP
jgi:hypothetical protein